ncbi:MAG TPA: AAC(3) family N-acetyltransferase [Anaerolineaceae bacterium]|nr:AAC(3) family N-acetyltransferase [Anaerolineaceae bacterium]
MVTFRDLVSAFRKLDLDHHPVIVHAAMSSLDEVRGGAESLLGALLTVQPAVMMPCFTYQTMIVPETGPEHNGIQYGSAHDRNHTAEFFRKRLPADPEMGALAEALRNHPRAERSLHPLLSFCGIGVDEALEEQTLSEPLAPIGALTRAGGWVLLLGVDHTRNTSIHSAERLAGRKTFTRWALTTDGVRECPNIPGCAQGFNALEPYLAAITRTATAGSSQLRALPLQPMIQVICDLLAADRTAFLCSDPGCERCAETRAAALTPN